jgi:hypothetical protein
MDKSKPSYELATGTHLITKRGGSLTFIAVVGAAADVTVSCYDTDVAANVASTNKIAAIKLDVDVVGMHGNITFPFPVSFQDGLVVVVEGAGGLAYVGHIKG